MIDQTTYAYEAVGGDRRLHSGVIAAPGEAAAIRRLAADGMVVTRISATRAKSDRQNRSLRSVERVLILRQLGLMLEAGVSLLEAMDTVSQGMQSKKGHAQFQAAIAGLRRGDSFGHVLENHAPGFPDYLYAMARVGEASGRIAEVLKQAAEQMAYEDRLKREFSNAMTYPAFLLLAGLGAVGFIFTQVVPRFAAMIGEDRSRVPAVSRWVLAAGEYANAHMAVVGLGFAALVAVIVAIVVNPSVRARAYEMAHGLPVVGNVMRAREIAAWSRLTSFALGNGVQLLQAVTLARAAVPLGPFRQGLNRLDRDLKAGVTLDASLASHTRLEQMDLSLLRAGQRSGALAAMFGFMADNYENRLRDSMKRLTSLLEPMAIGSISIIVGFVALSLVLALSSVYEGVA